MNAIDNFIERSTDNETIGPPSYYEDNWIDRAKILSDSNSDVSSQTQLNSIVDHSSIQKANIDHLLFFRPHQKLARERFKALQKWEGYVVEVGRDVFVARLIPIIGEGSEQEAEIYLSELADEDISFVQPGAVFYWSIGYLESPGRKRASIIRFRRLPVWTRQEVEQANLEATRLQDLFDVE